MTKDFVELSLKHISNPIDTNTCYKFESNYISLLRFHGYIDLDEFRYKDKLEKDVTYFLSLYPIYTLDGATPKDILLCHNLTIFTNLNIILPIIKAVLIGFL